MKRQRRRLIGGALAATASAALPPALTSAFAQAQGYPARPIKIIVPFPAGGTTDIAARLVAQRMSESMGQQVVVENRGGAGGSIGADAVAKSPPDGYTLLMHNITFPVSGVSLAKQKRLPYDMEKDFAGVSIAVNVPFVVTAHPSVPAKDLRELAELLRKDKSLQYNYGSTGPGSIMHVLGEAFKTAANVEMTHVPFRGAAPLKLELLSGRIQVGGDQLSSSLAEIRAGQLKALATSSAKRSSALPDVPTVRELGFAQLEFEGWNGLFVPARTPKEIIDRLHQETVRAVNHPEVKQRFADLAAEAVGSTPKEQEAIVKLQMDQFRPVIEKLTLD
ncbi:MAG TPA: tripartite tricarboxylate transporter substrate binding protein [Burkholderiaceae bacterium]|nr:tripartite tricarboxylate transporter substrate binding protein [Burkholderiaceae bacterium]